MQPTPLGRSSLAVSPVILGAWAMGGWFWGGADDEESILAIRAAVDAGITSIDTAPVYGFGHSERVLGRGLVGIRDQVQIMTKVGLRWDTDEGEHFFDTTDPAGKSWRIMRNLQPTSIRWEVEQSLQRLGVDHIDLIQCHWPDPSTPIPASMDTLASLVKEGKVGAVGVSNFSPEQMVEAEAALGGLPLASNQPKYSLLHRGIEKDVLPHCLEHQVGVVVYSPMARGILTGRVGLERQFPASDGRSTDPLYHPENRVRVLNALEQIQGIADAHGVSLANLAVAWVIHQPGVTGALVGARTAVQAVENAAAGQISLTDDELSTMRMIFESVKINKRPGRDE
jgi:aryl-alcohol dehydrogenase-like predicted oxidoreductase